MRAVRARTHASPWRGGIVPSHHRDRMSITSTHEHSGVFRQVVSIDAHTLHADVAPALGGTGSAPGPHDYFDAALATCKALTACVVAKQRGMALERVRVEVVRDDAEERKGRYVLTAKIAFEGALSEEEKAKLHDLLTRCPIHKLMTTSTVEIVQQRVDAPGDEQ
jgi:putative redox protein